MNEAFYCARRRGRSEVRPQRDIADGARHPRVIWAVGESGRGQARNRLTGIRTRGSPGPDKVALVIWGMDVFVSRRSWLSPGHRQMPAPANMTVSPGTIRRARLLVITGSGLRQAPVAERPRCAPACERREQCPKSTISTPRRAIGALRETAWKWRAPSRVKGLGQLSSKWRKSGCAWPALRKAAKSPSSNSKPSPRTTTRKSRRASCSLQESRGFVPLAEIAQSQVLSPVPMRIKGVEIASCASQLGTIVQPTNANLNVRSMLSVFCFNAYYNAVSNVAHA